MKLDSEFIAPILALSLSACDTSFIAEKDDKDQSFRIELSRDSSSFKLPATTNMKMSDMKMDRYIDRICRDLWSAERCDVYVVPEESSNLIGYATLVTAGNQISFSTDTYFKLPTGEKNICLLGGAVENIEVCSPSALMPPNRG